MSRLPGFAGGYAIARSVNVNVERMVNFIYEVGTGSPKVPGSLYKRPGLLTWIQVGGAPVRALFYQDNRMFAVGGATFTECFATQTSIARGTVVVDGNPATICSNGGSDGSGGHQLLVTSGGHVYIFDLVANTFTEITATGGAAGLPVPALMGLSIDGYFALLKSQSNQFNLSNLEDGTLWDGLDVGEVSQWPGQILAMVKSHNEIWLMSQSLTSPWYDSGASFPFQPVLGTTIEAGVLAPWSVVNLDNTLYWLGQTAWGGAQVFLADGYTPKRISTFAIETRLQAIADISTAIGWTMQIGGHSFYVLYLPTNDTHFVYDAASGMWTEWAHWDDVAVRWTPFVGRCHTWAFGKHLVGARNSGVIYEMTFDAYTDGLVP